MRIKEVIDALERAPRQGGAADDPEGGRYVVIIQRVGVGIVSPRSRRAFVRGAALP